MKKACGGFDFCFWAKVAISLPAIPAAGFIVAHYFTDPGWQFAMAAYTGAVVVIVSQYIDRLPGLKKKFGGGSGSCNTPGHNH